MKIEESIESINALIVRGEISTARREVKALLQARIPAPFRGKVANLARRVDLPLLGIRVLSPLVRPSDFRKYRPTPFEIAEYGACLTFIGASAEALTLLKGVPSQECPEGLLYRSFALFSQWDYAAAIPLLEEYVRSSKITDYFRAVGKVNLLAALVNERRYADAETLKEELAGECARLGYQRLVGNVYELAAYNYVNQMKVAAAEKTLRLAETLFRANATLDSFYVKKWGVLLDFRRQPGLERSVSALHAIRAEAQQRKLWETVRECDGYEAVFRKDPSLLAHVYSGTPYPRFRARLLEDYGKIDLPAEYVLTLRDGAEAPTLDSVTGTLLGKRGRRMKPGQSSHRLLSILFADFYRPLRVAVAHHELFPDEYFNPASSGHRVHQAICRLRNELAARKIPLKIGEKEGFYRVSATRPLKVKLPGPREAVNLPALADYHLLAQKWAEGEFSVRECVAFLKVSKRTTIRSLNRLVDAELAVRVGRSSATRYRLKKA